MATERNARLQLYIMLSSLHLTRMSHRHSMLASDARVYGVVRSTSVMVLACVGLLHYSTRLCGTPSGRRITEHRAMSVDHRARI